MSAVLLILSLAAVAAYACRMGPMTWRRHPCPMATHALGGMAAFWVMAQSAQGFSGPDLVALLTVSIGWLALTFPRAMARRRITEPS